MKLLGANFTPVDERQLWLNSSSEYFLSKNLHPYVYMLFKATRKDSQLRYQTLEDFDADFEKGAEALKTLWNPNNFIAKTIEITPISASAG